ncbi:hypothetical protein D5272_08020 [bacterium D16-76]|nr:hypothetical protein [bacterium D16-76]
MIKNTKATKLAGYEASEPISFSVKLPAGFVTDTTKDDVIVKHWDKFKPQVIEWLSTTVSETKANYTATFEATTFSPFELTVDARTAAVEYTTCSKTYPPTLPSTAQPSSGRLRRASPWVLTR